MIHRKRTICVLDGCVVVSNSSVSCSLHGECVGDLFEGGDNRCIGSDVANGVLSLETDEVAFVPFTVNLLSL